TGRGTELHAAIADAIAAAGAPAVTDVDHVGRTHAIWTITADAAAGLLALAGGGDLVVADGNHRSLAAQTGGLSRFLAVITTPGSVAIQPYHRLLTELPVPLAELLDGLRAAGSGVHRLVGAPGIPDQGIVHLYGRGGGYQVELAAPSTLVDAIVDGMDHALVERLVMRDGLGLEPGDKRITYVGGDYSPQWLVGEVDAGRAELAILIAPVTVDEFVVVNLARQKMPRKSTWFTPKARGGLVLADLAAEG
ncbi:MAG: hypothetical protein QOE61_1856, partial [Micromonosporaceae bacterium]|nr:hypothetical protein [Micromonosporaceae bacterium]